jgi:L-malate glycosyltransferase
MDKERLKTLHINTERTWRGGEAQTLNLVRGLVRAGHAADLVCQPGSPLAERAAAQGITVLPLRMRGEADLVAAWRIRRALARSGHDLVHAHTSHAHALAVLAALGRATKVIVSRRVDFSILRRASLGLSRLKYRYGFDRIIAVSNAIKDVLVHDGVRPELITTVHSGVDPARFPEAGAGAPFPADLPVRPGDVLVVNTAHLTPHKGQIHLVRAFAEVRRAAPAARLLIVGQGELHGELAAEIERLGLGDRAFLTGFRADIGSILAHTTVFAMPSVEEGLGTAVLDAFLFGLPVVASRAGGIPEMVEDGRNGLLVPPADPPALAAAIVRLLADAPLRATLGQAARDTVRSSFTDEHMIRGTIAVYADVLAGSTAQ